MLLPRRRLFRGIVIRLMSLVLFRPIEKRYDEVEPSFGLLGHSMRGQYFRRIDFGVTFLRGNGKIIL